ncbi:hypothetical protein KC363_g8745 [Hortaea werneckii]|uniref:HIT-type domain-containing protein n=1 Tax=Hortaea werneckii TaxID=91943 RepID=A0A3M7EUW6_HORWE|nr:hypothetical protein KC363_g8745 [Hortaea werneckii]RMY80197.1 hypothetical protein D0861_08621 [Hortaea werneckii]
MSTSTPLCGICTAYESKYKCPVCGLRYCSLACYKQHQPLHATTSSSSSSEEEKASTTQLQQQPTSPHASRQRQDRPGPNRRGPKIDLTRFDSDPAFLALLHRYPRLRIQLQALYALTLEPGPEEARTWSRQPLPGESAPPATGTGFGQRGRGGGRRGGRGRGRGGGSGLGGHATPSEGRQHGLWTVEKGEKEALGTMRRMRVGNQNNRGGGDKAEGLKEFIELCRLRFGPESQNGEVKDGGGG